MVEEVGPTYDPASYGYQEGILGEVPTFIRLFNFRIYGVTGVPSASLGANNDWALRTDGAAGACLYQKRANVWVATGA